MRISRTPSAHLQLPVEIATELRELGRLDDAREMLEAQLPRITHPSSLWHQLGQIGLFRDDSEEAMRCFEAGIAAQPKQLPCYLGLVWECLRLGLFERAEAAIEMGKAQGVAQVHRLELMHVRLLRARGEPERARVLAEWLRAEMPGDFECALMLESLLVQQADFDAAASLLDALSAKTPAQSAQLARQRAGLALAQYDLEGAEQHLSAALDLNPKEAEAHQLLAKVRLMRGDSPAAGRALKAAEALLLQHPSERRRAGAKGGLRFQIWREFRTNPFAERALLEAQALPLAARPAAMAKVLEDEPNHAGTAIAWLVALRRNGAWETQRPLQQTGRVPAIPRRIVQFWDSPDIPEGIRDMMRSWPEACQGFEHEVFDDARAEAFIAAECAPAVLKAFRMANHPTMRSDLFRLAYLAVRGGIYADADDRCRHSLQSWVEAGFDLLLLQEDVGSIGNNFIAAAPNHPFIRAALEAVTRNSVDRQGDSIWFLSGPGALSLAFCRHYADDLRDSRLPPGVSVRDVFHLQQLISMHLPCAYKQDDRHWCSPKAAAKPLYRRLPVHLNVIRGAPKA